MKVRCSLAEMLNKFKTKLIIYCLIALQIKLDRPKIISLTKLCFSEKKINSYMLCNIVMKCFIFFLKQHSLRKVKEKP